MTNLLHPYSNFYATQIVPNKEEFKDWQLEKGLLYWKGKVYVPSSGNSRRQIMELHHNAITARHQGQACTLQLIKRSYWWPSMKAYINKYVESCDLCQRTKTINRLPRGELQPLEVPSKPWSHISCDFIVKLPNSMGYNSILVVVDSFTKMAHSIPTREDIDAPGVAELFLNYIWKLHGTPDSVVSDRGAVFASCFLRELYLRLQIKPHLSSAYHPQMDGKTKFVNRRLVDFLRSLVTEHHSQWDHILPQAEFAYNDSFNRRTG